MLTRLGTQPTLILLALEYRSSVKLRLTRMRSLWCDMMHVYVTGGELAVLLQ